MHKLKIGKQRTQYGFTIVELLIVIVVIGILASITTAAYQGVQKNASDAKSVSLASLIEKKATLYYQSTGKWPSANDLKSSTAPEEAKLSADIVNNIATSSGGTTGTKFFDPNDTSVQVALKQCDFNGRGINIFYWKGGEIKITVLGEVSVALGNTDGVGPYTLYNVCKPSAP